MRGKTSSIGWMAALAILVAALFVTGTWAAAQEKVLHNFSGIPDGASPMAGLIWDAAGNLYGTTVWGGTSPSCGGGCGTVFELTPAAGGGWTEKVLWSFGNGTDGVSPVAGMVFDAAGNLYGTTLYGGTTGFGTVFELTPAADGTWAEKVLYSFGNGTDGSIPDSGLIFDADGNLYGTTTQGGTFNQTGTVFELTPAAGGIGTEKVLHSFGNGTDGTYPEGGLIFDAAGNLYGTTWGGGAQGNGGTVFELTTAAGGTWPERGLHNFGSGADGAHPGAGLVFDAAGNLYGTTRGGGTYGGGTVFELTPAG